MVRRSMGGRSSMRVLSAVLLLSALQCACALSPTDCDSIQLEAEKILDLINKGRRNGYRFQLLQVADAHLDIVEPATVYYLVLDVTESDCWVLSTKSLDDCQPSASRRPSDIVIGQCKVVATRYSNDSQDIRVNDFNCTTSSVSSALSNTKDSPVLLDFFEDPETYRRQADLALDKHKGDNDDFASFRVDKVERVIRVRGGERTIYYVDFSVRNCSTRRFPRHFAVFGFCKADLSYDITASDLENPENIGINCEVFDFEEHRNISGAHPPWGHPPRFGRPEHSFGGKHEGKFGGFRGRHHPHKTHNCECPPPPEEKDSSDATPKPPCHHPHFDTSGSHRHPHNHSEHGHHPHGPHPHGPHPHGPHPHGPHPHGPHPHGPHPHRHPPHGHDFHDYGPCDPPSDGREFQGHPRHGHGRPHDRGRPHDHSGERGPGKGRFPFHHREIGNVYRLPPLNAGEVLPPPEADFHDFSRPNCKNPQQPEIQPFPQSASGSCPGKFSNDFPQLSKFFKNTK